MNLKTKSDLSQWSLNGLTFITCFGVAAITILVFSSILQFVPFNENTATALLAAFFGGIGLAALLLILNIAANLSLIASVKAQETALPAMKEGKSQFGKWVGFTLTLAGIGCAVTIGGTIASKAKFSGIVREQTASIVKEQAALLDQIGTYMEGGKVSDYKEITRILSFLQKQKNNLPSATVIFADDFKGKTAYYEISNYYGYSSDEKRDPFKENYFTCETSSSCKWMDDFFTGKAVETLYESGFTGNEFRVYYPVASGKQKYILQFQRRQNYGKIGSY